MRQLIRGATTRSIERAHCCAGAGPPNGRRGSQPRTNALDKRSRPAAHRGPAGGRGECPSSSLCLSLSVRVRIARNLRLSAICPPGGRWALALSRGSWFDKQYENYPEAVANPLELLERIGRLQAQLPKLQADCAEIAAAKAELRDSTTATMVANRRSIAYGAPLPRLAAVTRTSTRVRQF